MCGHNADVALWTYRTPRVVTGSSCGLRDAFPNDLEPSSE
jgi:hypothetical protein